MADEQEKEPLPTPEHVPPVKQRRLVPRSAWWLLGIAAILILLFGAIRPAWFTRPPNGAPLRAPAERLFSKTFAGLGREDGIWLTSDIPAATFDVILPVDSARTKTRLRMVGTTQVAEDSTVFLQVLMDGQQVYEHELPRGGENRFDDAIAVPDVAAADGRVRVQLRTRGILSHQRCTPDQSAGMVIHLDSRSVVEAELDQPLHTVRDVATALDDDVAIVVPDPGHEWFATAAALGMALLRAGHEITYTTEVPADIGASAILVGPEQTLAQKLGWTVVGEGAAEASIRIGTVNNIPLLGVVAPEPELAARMLSTPARISADTAATTPEALQPTILAGDEVALESLGVDLSEVQITDSRSWRVPYSLADLPGGRLPRAIRLDLRLPAAPDDLTWILNVNLNGRMLDSRRLARSAEPVLISLPAGVQLLRNQLTVTVQRDRDLGGCDVRVASYPMQMSPASALELGDDPGTGFTALPRPFSTGLAVQITSTADPVALLNTVVPVISEFTSWETFPDFVWGPQTVTGRPFILVGEPTGTTALMRIEDGRLLAGAAPVLDLTAFTNGLIVQCATGPGSSLGLVVSPVGTAGVVPLPNFGRECVQTLTPDGGFAVVGDGEVYVVRPARQAPG